jgi:hypothetical protein
LAERNPGGYVQYLVRPVEEPSEEEESAGFEPAALLWISFRGLASTSMLRMCAGFNAILLIECGETGGP